MYNYRKCLVGSRLTLYKTNNKKQKQRTDRNPIRGKGVVTRLHKYFFLGVPPSLPLVSGPGRKLGAQQNNPQSPLAEKTRI